MLNTSHDVGGFAGPVPDAELLVRWTQAGLLHPRFIMDSWKPGGVFNSPWLHPAATPAIRDAIRLRYQLMPYLCSLMHAAADAGEPVIQPTFRPFDTDPRCFEDCDELMLGPFLLAAPSSTPVTGNAASICRLVPRHGSTLRSANHRCSGEPIAYGMRRSGDWWRSEPVAVVPEPQA